MYSARLVIRVCPKFAPVQSFKHSNTDGVTNTLTLIRVSRYRCRPVRQGDTDVSRKADQEEENGNEDGHC